jgi:hypothetical protein
MGNLITKLFGGTTIKAVDSVFSGVTNIIDEVITSKEEKAILQIKMNELQTVTNNKNAENPSLFVSGWRPFIGWVCGSGIGFNFVIRPIMNYILLVFYPAVETMPSLDVSVLLSLITGMLGFAGLRTFEKIKNKERN